MRHSTNNGTDVGLKSNLDIVDAGTGDADLSRERCVQTSADIFSVDVFAWKTGEQHDFVEFVTNQLFVATIDTTKYWDYDLRVSNMRMPSVTSSYTNRGRNRS